MEQEGKKATEIATIEDQAIYYSSWVCGAIRVLTTIPEFRTREAISKKLNLPLEQVTDVVQFLATKGFLSKKQNQYFPTEKFIYLEKNSPFMTQIHSSWRAKAVESMSRTQEDDFHFFFTFSCAKKDLKKLKKRLTQCLDECHDIITPSVEETAACLCFDLFEL